MRLLGTYMKKTINLLLKVIKEDLNTWKIIPWLLHKKTEHYYVKYTQINS